VRKLASGKWVCEVRRQRPKYYGSKTFDTKLEAEQWGLDKERSLNFHKGTPSKRILKDAMEKYRETEVPKHRGAKWELVRMRHLMEHPMCQIQLDDLRTEDFQSWITERGLEVSPATVRREFQLFRASMKHARVKLKWTTNHPLEDVEVPRSPKHRTRRISDEEIELICSGLNYTPYAEVKTQRHSVGAAFLLAIETAMRQGEIWRLEIDPKKLERSYCTVYGTKNGDDRDVPLSPNAIRLIKSFPDWNLGRLIKNVGQDTAAQMFRRTCQLAKIENLTFHDSRHEGTTRLARKLKPLDLAKAIGHRDPRSVMIYYNPTAEEMAESLR